MIMYKLSLSLVISLLVLSLAGHAAAGGPKKALPELKNDGKIAIYNYHEDEYAEIVYRDKDGYRAEGLREIEHIMRSRGDGATHPIDRRLIEILDHVQDHFGAETVEIISGYRSPAYNDNLRMNGRGAARESLHKRGQAADIHIDEVPEDRIFEYVSKLGVGGVGYYPRYYFVHVDVGDARSWQEAPPKERVLVGTENNPNDAWCALTDKGRYAPGETVTIKLTNNGYQREQFKRNVWLEGFRKGKWSERKRIIKRGAKRIKPGASSEIEWKIPKDQRLGKYRLTIFVDPKFEAPPVLSNEFYVR